MTDPQFPPPAPYGPPAPGSVPPVPQAPAYQSPPGAYTAPVGGYSAPAGPYQAPAAPVSGSPALGVIAFVLSVIAGVVAPIIGGISGYQVGFGLPTVMSYVDSTTADLSVFSPVRDQILVGEIGFWTGTLAGITAIVLGIIAIAKRRGRVWGIVSLILAGLGPVLFFLVLSITLGIGAGAGTATYLGS